MNCEEAREQILEFLAEPQSRANADHLQIHLAGCKACLSFYDTHLQLDRQLSIATGAPSPSPRFRDSVLNSLGRYPYSTGPEFLPDKAHLMGCFCALAISVLILPFPAILILEAGLAFTLATYFLQSVILSSLENREEAQQ